MNNLVQVMDRPIVSKLVTLKWVGGNGHQEFVDVFPGNSAGEILQRVGLDGDFILTNSDRTHAFGFDEVIYPDIRDGDLLYVSSEVSAGFRNLNTEGKDG